MSTAVISSGTLYEPRAYGQQQQQPVTRLPSPDQQAQSEDGEKKKKKKKTLRHAVGLIVIDPATKRVLMLSSRKRENAYVLPKGDCIMPDEEENKSQTKPESYEDAAFRVLMESGIKARNLSRRIAVYTDANKRGKIIGHHAMFECTDFTLLHPPVDFDRTRVWVAYDVALRATEDRPLSLMALKNSTLAQ